MNFAPISLPTRGLLGRKRLRGLALTASLLITHSVFAGESGKLTREVWFNLPGGQLAEFVFSPRYWQAADNVSTFAGAVAPTDTVDNFAARIRGYVTAPVSGEYTFWIASDDDSELYLSRDDSKFNRVKIASLAGFVSPQAWDVKPSQKSVAITLEAGQRYFIEALHKDGRFGDHLALAWQVSGSNRELIPASALESFTSDSNDVDNDELPDDWETAHGFSLTDNGTVYPEQHPLADADQDGLTNLQNSGYPYNPIRVGGPGTGEPGRMTREFWYEIPGGELARFTTSPLYWKAADSVTTFAGSAAPMDTDNNFAARIRAYLTPAVSGEYTFWIASDDDSELYLSTDSSKFHRVKIASLAGYVNPQDWDVKSSQKSVSIPLVAGQHYFIEALHKDGIGGDHCAIAWQALGGPRELIPAASLESFAIDPTDRDNDELPDDWELAHGFEIYDNGTLNPAGHPLADPDHDGVSNLRESQLGTDPGSVTGPAAANIGRLTRELWWNIPGDQLSDFTFNPRYWQAPDSVSTFSGAAAPADIADDFASRVRGYITAPVTGNYTFWIASDDSSQLDLSTDRSKFNRVRIASLNGWTQPQEWTKYPTQQSLQVPLVAGQSYFIEALLKEGRYGDHLEIAWQVPGGVRELIPAHALEAYAEDANDMDRDELPDDWEQANGFSLAGGGNQFPDQHPTADPDHDGYSNLEESQFGTDPNERGGIPGSLLLETWSGIPGAELPYLTWNRRFYQNPDKAEFTFAAEVPQNRAEDFGARLRGYVIAPVSGDYTFYVAGDDGCELWLSTGENQFAKEKIAFNSSWTNLYEWTKFESQKSKVIPLVAGKKYYIEALMKEAIYGDHLAVGWAVPGSDQISVIPGGNLESYAYAAKDPDGDNMPETWEENHGLDPTINDAALDPDADAIPNALEYAGHSDPQEKNRFTGALLHELWLHSPGYGVHSPEAERRRLQPADQVALAISLENGARNIDEYTDRFRGYITAPVTGAYTFWATGDEETEVWLSTSASKSKKQLLIRTGTQIRNFDADHSLKSREVTLEAGERYYLEILHLNDHGWDFCDVAWQIPGGQRQIIPSSALSSYVPSGNDMDDDDLPDDWEIANGLDPNDNGGINPENGAHGDLDGDGLDNAAERLAHTRADLADTDGDGVNDYDEAEILETSVLTADVAPFQSIAVLPGASYVAAHGEWVQENGKAKQASVRGWLEYPVSLTAAGVYQFDLSLSSVADGDVARDYEIVFSVDGNQIERRTLNLLKDASGHAKVLSPWLAAGNHTLRLFVDNSHYYRRVSVDQLEVLAARGPDADANGSPDWVDIQLAKRNSIKASGKSITSPVCLEGKARWSGLTTVAGLPVQTASNDRWFTNVPLDPTQPTVINYSLENGAISDTRPIRWVPVNLLETPSLTLRQGDSLKLTAFSGERATASQLFTLNVDGQTVTAPSTQPLVYTFTTAGTVSIQATHDINGKLTSINATVTVIGAPAVMSPVCVLGSYREVALPVLASGVSFEMDDRIEIRESSTAADGSLRYLLRLNTMDDRTAVFRLGDASGPILAALPFRSMRVRSAGETAIFVEQELGNDTYQIGMPVIVDGLHPDVTIEYDIFMAGVTFDDGSLRKVLIPPADFDEDGQRLLHFLKVGTGGSNCHRFFIWQQGTRIAVSQ